MAGLTPIERNALSKLLSGPRSPHLFYAGDLKHWERIGFVRRAGKHVKLTAAGRRALAEQEGRDDE